MSGGPEDQAQAQALFARYRSRYPSGVFGEEALFYLWYLEGRAGTAAKQRVLGEQFMREFPRSERAERVRQWLDEHPTP